ncbi:ParB N-terminal domain-containing protein [Nocardia terpenica]|uniref:Uncharacterized protein n=1 Tax=Nocardia terpenica TaxID=455432 RepID=A0A6G9ZE79_9NOCA|nr:ParB N-terminal domain-containing protein [Nocardia terpenica]QIS23711.1 hypothetical protein F6W96_40965 [Nocardia terpenica]
MQDVVEAIAPLIETRYGGIDPVHEADDQSKLAALAADMEVNGWQGAPLVVAGEQALTGAHRYLAARRADIEIPRVQIDDVCELYGVDWAALEDTYGCCDGYDWYEAARHLDEVLPVAVIDYLGIDVH